MAKKVKPCPAWLATFADLMSLLMALFVLLFAMSSVDAKKYASAVESLTDSLGHGQDMTQTQVQYFKAGKENASGDTSKTGQAVLDDLHPLFESLIETYATQNDPSIKINFDPTKNQIKVTFSEQISFPSGQASLKPKLIFYLRKLKVYLNDGLFVKAIGHTDSIPVRGGRYPSNWALSSARAASVIERLVRDRIVKPTQAEAVGVADTQPLVKENTPKAYAKNRRVEIVLMPLKLRD